MIMSGKRFSGRYLHGALCLDAARRMTEGRNSISKGTERG